MRTAIQTLLILGVLLATAPLAAEPAADPAVTLTAREGGGYRVEARFTAAASSATAFAVLADYDNLPRFITSMRESRVTARDGAAVTLEQTARGRWLFFSKLMHVRLRVAEGPGRIDFRDENGGDFDFYAGGWRVETGAGGATVSYFLDMKSKAFVPGPIERSVVRRGIRDTLEQVKREIERRGHIPPGAPDIR